MAVFNVHERRLPVKPEELAPLIDGLSGRGDRLWPAERAQWPAMALDQPLAIGAKGGHGPVRYSVIGYAPGQWVRFGFTAPRGFEGFHEYTVHHDPDGEGAILRHTLAMCARGTARLSWPLAFRWFHDAVIEDSLDRAERASTGTVARPKRWSAYVRLLRRLSPG